MQEQILEYIGKHLSPHLCGYRKRYSTQTDLISMLENWKLSIENKVLQVDVARLWIQQTAFSYNMVSISQTENK